MKKYAYLMLSTLMLLSGQALAQKQEWNFQVYLNDQKIGHHSFLVEADEGLERVISEASYDVKFLFVTAYTYRHTSLETWRNNCLVSIQSQTDDNGTKQYISGQLQTKAQPQLLRLSTHDGNNEVSGCVKSFSYWNPTAVLDANRLLNSQTGEYVDIESEFVGSEAYKFGNKSIDSKHYRLSMEGYTIDLWYAADNDRWVGLESTTKSGAVIKYRLEESGEQL
ncbi:MAG: hypothetical protein HUJ29_12010 [Gammaproteobacteria bacterium]|nr:hypothetical protein [Gammaproteobacteria bacterium]